MITAKEAIANVEEREARSVTISGELARDIWRMACETLHEVTNQRMTLERREEELRKLLSQMKEVGMQKHIPTIDEMRAIWKGDGEDVSPTTP